MMDFKSIINFEKMIVPRIIKVLFWIGVGVSVLTGIGVFFGGIIGGVNNDSAVEVFGGLIGGPIVMILMILWTRILSEFTILFFQMNETLTDIKHNLQEK
jgi:hypothetical protein